MRPIHRPVLLALGMTSLAACVPNSAPPAPAPPPAPPPSLPPPQPAPPPMAWQEAPLTPGDWIYRRDDGRSAADFAGMFELRCDGGLQIRLVRSGAGPGEMWVSTTYGTRGLTAAAEQGALVVRLAASDPLLDEMAFSRGRFAVQARGTAMLILPAWPEPARVIEDCRE